MSSAERFDRALAGLRELDAPASEPGEAARRRRRVVAKLDTLSIERNVRNKLLLSGGAWLGIAVAAAIVLAVGIGWFTRHSMPGATARLLETTGTVQVAGQAAQGAATSMLTPNAEIATLAGSSAKLETDSGVRMALGSESRLQIAGQADGEGVERVDLNAGSVDVRVPKLGPKRQFRVVTPDAVVIVHGTEFTVVVSKQAEGAPRTEVVVKSGRVEVRRKSEVVFLSGGKAWSSEGERRAERAVPEKQSPTRGAAPPEDDEEQTAQNLSRGVPRGAKPSRLARANALLARARAAAAKGDDRTALRHLDELLKRFGDSPVAASARVERFRALKRLGRDTEAASAADEYLDKERDGVARDEARALGK